MNPGTRINSKITKKICKNCQIQITPDKEYMHESNFFCEDCCIDIRIQRQRKTHWQYIKSVKTEYLIHSRT